MVDETTTPASEAIPIISDPKQLLQYGVCKVPIATDSIDTQKWATELSQVSPMNMAGEGDGEYAFYRNMFDEPDFPFYAILSKTTPNTALSPASTTTTNDENVILAAPCQATMTTNNLSDIGHAIKTYFDVPNVVGDIRLHDAFCVHYNMDQLDTSGAKHTDPSDITVNMCLEKTDNAQGSHVLFYGTRKLQGVEENVNEQAPEKFLVVQEPGCATIHWGDHPHETMPLLKGKRTNLVFTYWYNDPKRSGAAMRTCY